MVRSLYAYFKEKYGDMIEVPDCSNMPIDEMKALFVMKKISSKKNGLPHHRIRLISQSIPDELITHHYPPERSLDD